MIKDIEEYYIKYGPMVLRRCRFLLKDEDMALDAMQEVFVNLLKNRERLKGDYPSSLLYKIATNICLNILRADKRRVTGDSEAIINSIASYDDTEERIEAGDLLDRIFSREKPSTREIAVMFYLDRMTLDEIAAEAGLSVSGVRKRIRTLRERVLELKELMP